MKTLALDCTAADGKLHSIPVDLTSSDTFAPPRLNLQTERGVDRPALKGNPLSYKQEQLLQSGYGLRPDPKNAKAYARWLSAATIDGRMLDAKHPNLHNAKAASATANPWVGSAMTGKPHYLSTEAIFNVPQAIPGGDQTTTTEVAIWNGLGGYYTGSGLIQGGVNLYTTNSYAAYGTWREYCCGDPDSNGFGGNFTPNPGDSVYSQEWYCDASGNPAHRWRLWLHFLGRHYHRCGSQLRFGNRIALLVSEGTSTLFGKPDHTQLHDAWPSG